MEQLELYRAGLFNSYKLSGYAEGVQEFEGRVAQALSDINAVEGESVHLVIAHRSSITAILLRMARLSLGYPIDYYGYVHLDVGRLSAFSQSLSDQSVKWLGVNFSAEELPNRLDRLLG
jgi:broad specificity phosphatase PhoE